MAPGSVQELALQPRGFVAAMTVRIPPTPVLVRPSVSEELKHGYMQYVAFLVLTATLGAFTPIWLRSHNPPQHATRQYLFIVNFPCVCLPCLAAWILRKVIFGYHILEASIYVDAPRSKLHIE
jgi:glycerol-3-phosphate acyltransferase PlsY